MWPSTRLCRSRLDLTRRLLRQWRLNGNALDRRIGLWRWRREKLRLDGYLSDRDVLPLDDEQPCGDEHRLVLVVVQRQPESRTRDLARPNRRAARLAARPDPAHGQH